MPNPLTRFDANSVRESWDNAAEVYTSGQAAGRDHYRYAFFGPAQIELCGDVHGLRILDVGCGNGYFAREMAQRGAVVTAIDISPGMIEHARRQATSGIDYHVLDAAQLGSTFLTATFDMATSCLALCDMPDPPKILQQVRSVLRPGGRFIASITHPCTDTPYRRWERDDAGSKKWLCIDNYFNRGPYEYAWTGWGRDFTTPGLHATLEDWVRWALDAGFELRGFYEPRPTPEALMAHPDLEDAARVPYYVIFDLVRRQ